MSLGRLAEAAVGDPGSPPVFPFTRPLVIPPTLTPGPGPAGQDSYTITMQEATANIIPGRPTPVWAYNGIYPGPTIRARRNRQVNIRQVNNLSESMSVHLHGAHVPPTSDGHPTDLIAPGQQKDYNYPNNQLPAPLWYHDHAVDVTGHHVYMGLSGFYLMSDSTEDNLNLPGPGTNGQFQHDVPLLIQDRLFNKNGSFSYPLTDDALVRGVLGDRILVNGVIQPFFPVTRRKWRFRLLNGSNARIYDFALSNGQPFIQIGSDGGLLSAPVTRNVIRLGPAERADVVIDFTGLTFGQQVFLRNLNRMVPLTVDRAPRDIMRFDIGSSASDSSQVPASLRPFTAPGTEDVPPRDFILSRGVQNGRTVWFINAQLFDENRIDANVVLGNTERWRFINNSNVSHPMHIHLVQFVVVGAGAGDDHWKDTVNVPPGGTVEVRARFTDYTGTYVFHCHVLEHEDHAMMAQFSVS
jgi:spore coat protein A